MLCCQQVAEAGDEICGVDGIDVVGTSLEEVIALVGGAEGTEITLQIRACRCRRKGQHAFTIVIHRTENPKQDRRVAFLKVQIPPGLKRLKWNVVDITPILDRKH
eukprot:2567897-Rhodomonas_salina.2